MLITRSLCDLLVNDLQLELRGQTIIEVAADIVHYLTGVHGNRGAYELQHRLKEKVDFEKLEDSAKTFRLKLLETSYLSLKLKYFSFCLALHPFNTDNLQKFGAEFDMERNDVVLLKKVFELRGFRKQIRKSDRIADLNKNHVSYEAYQDMYDMFDEIYPNVMWHIKGMTNKKLRFITFSNNLIDSDFHSDLVCKAITTFNKLMPTVRDSLYVQNYVKRAVTNHVQNIIKSYTTQKRGRLVKGSADGYGGNNYLLTVMSENQLVSNSENGELAYDSLSSEQSNKDALNKQENEMHYRSLLKNYGKTKKRKCFIKLMSGIGHKGFTRYLHDNSIIDMDKDNEDYFHKVSQKVYLRHVCNYLEILPHRGQKFLKYLGKKVYPEKSEALKNAA